MPHEWFWGFTAVSSVTSDDDVVVITDMGHHHSQSQSCCEDPMKSVMYLGGLLKL